MSFAPKLYAPPAEATGSTPELAPGEDLWELREASRCLLALRGYLEAGNTVMLSACRHDFLPRAAPQSEFSAGCSNRARAVVSTDFVSLIFTVSGQPERQKRCRGCEAFLPWSQFAVHPRDGRMDRCMACEKARKAAGRRKAA